MRSISYRLEGRLSLARLSKNMYKTNRTNPTRYEIVEDAGFRSLRCHKILLLWQHTPQQIQERGTRVRTAVRESSCHCAWIRRGIRLTDGGRQERSNPRQRKGRRGANTSSMVLELTKFLTSAEGNSKGSGKREGKMRQSESRVGSTNALQVLAAVIRFKFPVHA